MTFTIFSMAVILLIATLILVWVFKGIKKGLAKMLIELGIALGAVVLGILAARYLSDPVTNLVLNFVQSTGMLASVESKIAHIYLLLFVIVDALISPLLFIALFFILRSLLRLIVGKIANRIMRDLPYDTASGSASDRWHHRNSKPLGAAVGFVCAIITSMVVASPIYGTIQTAGNLIGLIHGENAIMPMEQLKPLEKEINTFVDMGHDIPGTVLDVIGGEALYQMLSYSEVDYEGVYYDSKGVEHPETINFEVYMSKESESLAVILKDATGFAQLGNTGGLANKDNLNIVRTVVKDIHNSDFLELMAADVLSGAARNWRQNTTYMQVAKPNLGSSGNYLFDVVLFVLENTSYEYVTTDIDTMINVLEIMLDSNLMSEADYNELLFNYEENDTYKKLCNELMANPRTQTIPEQVTAMTVNIAAQAFTTLLTEDQYDKVTINIASQFNEISSVADRDTKVTVLSQKTQDVAGEYDVDMPESIANATADALVSQFQDRTQINSKDVDSFISQYKDFNFGTADEGN